MKNISDNQTSDLPVDGVMTSLKGKFFYRLPEDGCVKDVYANCYITEAFDIDSDRLYLSDEIGEAVIGEDETFGMMVGGEFAYWGVNAEVKCRIRKTTKGLVCENVEYLKLEKDGESQEFRF